MTREEVKEAIAQLERISRNLASIGETVDYTEFAIEALEQEPCEDAVSRQAVLDEKYLIELEDGQSFYCINPEDVEALPPVTPTHITCKDCKHYMHVEGHDHLDYCPKHGSVSSNHFCADAERREE